MKNKSPFSHKYFIYYPVAMAIEKKKKQKTFVSYCSNICEITCVTLVIGIFEHLICELDG